MKNKQHQEGYALITVLLLLSLVMALVTAYFTLTRIDLSTTGSSMSSVRGFYAAEAGLNLRSESVRGIFGGYNLPIGTPPATAGGQVPCDAGNDGMGDYSCTSFALQNRQVMTYLEDMPGSPTNIVVPRGERYQNLNAQEYRYVVASSAVSNTGHTEANLEMRLRSRLVPLFQFAAFYNKDLEILPGPAMQLSGPVHTNGDLYTDAGDTLDIDGQVTTAGDLYRGRKNQNTCASGPVRVADPAAQSEIPSCGGSRRHITQADVVAWNGMIHTNVEPVEVPQPETLDPNPGSLYWDRADLRIMLDLNGGGPVIELRNADNTIHLANATLNGCGGAVGTSTSLYDNREGTNISMLDVDMEELLDCVGANPAVMDGKALNDATDGGIVLYLGVDGPNSDAVNNYGVRVRNADEIAGVRGMTVASDQASYIEGHFNRVNKVPASVLADSLNILSDAWADSDSTLDLDDADRKAVATTINAAFLAGTDTTGGVEGSAGQNLDQYNGGLENYPRFHEQWSDVTFTYRGSLVSLNQPRYVDGLWSYGGDIYTAPNRDWDYDTDFNNAANLPPLAPRFTYLRQEMFVRSFE